DNFAVVGGVQLGAPLFSDPGNFTWARRVAKTGLPNGELALGTAVDAATNIYVTGWFDGSNDFGGTTLTSYGGQDGFVAKYNSTGALQWVRQVGGTNVEPMNTDYWDAARAVGVDGAGNVYVAGGFLGQATFSGAVLTSQGLQDAFLAKYSAAGQPQWVRQGGDASGRTYATGIAVDAAGDCLMVGCFNGQRASFGSTTANNPGYLNGAYGAFIAKFNNAGVPLWAQGLGGGDTYSTTVGMDAGGNCFVGGGFENTLQIGATNLTSAGGKDGFLAKFNSAGVLQWVRQVKGASMDGGRVGVDASGNCFFIGSLPAGVLDFGGQTITNTNASAMYVAKYDTLGGLLWVRQAEGTGVFMGSDGGCAVDQAGSCYIPGVFVGSATFGATTVTNRGGSDIFVAKYDAAGNFKWVQTAGGSLGDAALRLAADAGGTCYVAGWFQWIPAFGTNLLQAQGFRDVFLAKLAEPTIPLQFCFLSVSKGIFQTRLDGTPGASVIVDTSSDLTTWTPWRTNTLPAGGLTLAMPIGPNRQFFRARIP
ncbi:MAG: hypothetical protein NT154_28515, partial [Verrucomicrobia bacterium]|nr:hypothetical protein [Verrucomicrobiota bacterium]